MKKLLVMILSLSVLSMVSCSSSDTTSTSETTGTSETVNYSGLQEVVLGEYEAVEFVEVPGDGTTETFLMATTEITNEQYVKFLNDALADGLITFEAPDKDHYSLDNAPYENTVWDLDGNPWVYMGGSRVVKDHNSDGEYALAEMENPINRCYIEYNDETAQFQVVDPSVVDWSVYFDTSIYPNVVKVEGTADLRRQG